MMMRREDEASSDFASSGRSLPIEHDSYKPPSECRNNTCGHYPPINIIGTNTPRLSAVRRSTRTAQHPFVVSRLQLLQHIFRPGSPADRFDHPLIFLHSGVTFAKLKGHGRPGGDNGEIHSWSLGREGHEDFDLSEGIDIALPTTATIPGLLGLARSVLSLTPNVATLALAGFLERTVCGSRGPPGLSHLRALSLGPPPPFWSSPLQLDHAALEQVQALRIAGMIPCHDEECAIGMHCDESGSLELVIPMELGEPYKES